jgi:DDB1- and CUL4-associated factor 11
MDLHVIMQALFSTQSNESSLLTPITRGAPSISLSGINLRDLVRFVRERAGDFPSVSSNYQQDEEEGDEDDEADEENNSEGPDDYYSARHCFPPVKEAHNGEELLHSGDFGRVGIKIRSRANNCNLVKSVLNRAAHPIPNLNKEDLLSVCF